MSLIWLNLCQIFGNLGSNHYCSVRNYPLPRENFTINFLALHFPKRIQTQQHPWSLSEPLNFKMVCVAFINWTWFRTNITWLRINSFTLQIRIEFLFEAQPNQFSQHRTHKGLFRFFLWVVVQNDLSGKVAKLDMGTIFGKVQVQSGSIILRHF